MGSTAKLYFCSKSIYRHIKILLSNLGAIVQKRNPFYLKMVFVMCLIIVLFAGLQFDFIKAEKFPFRLNVITSYVDNKNSEQILFKAQQVQNDNLFEPLRNDSLVIVIQVHTRIEYLRHLIESLAKTRNISDTLLIFSHDYNDDKINELVRSIEFCRVLQIFYPYSIQKHKHEFPGEDPNDCQRNLNRNQALARNCNNANHPDMYGHYREAKFTQTKHHWWWKANQVFDHLDVTRHHTGLVLFLEEDHYVAEDFLYILTLMQKQMKNKVFAKCNILSLGTYLDSIDMYHHQRANEVKSMPWISVKHNMGFAFNRSTWNEILKCKNLFCTYDDYNWDWTLQHISEECLPQKFYALVATRPRVFHIGECGLHHETQNCKADHIVAQVRSVLAENTYEFYPKKLRLAVGVGTGPNYFEPNGGWGDVRDHNLCLSFTSQNKTIDLKQFS
ncbi:alpha-1,6-mannosyl-glycoprotein 2-beta-N-acetylglucosaminyltransferase-like [Contarinia nasturtii]|uniref:alpha-1,6-mannosyl-glycoprotein 2-beta-N-acetylglucosaminyltransferase-like n=1 Tax=Contarinia nasturtii TaxID=265458 RepID=UPI0012D3C904|nr:alpha-1,6-mannosyl-glycoprotein 2-beta-N-acetylglucosaminyltransferase-like [Contarinia nasturtii]